MTMLRDAALLLFLLLVVATVRVGPAVPVESGAGTSQEAAPNRAVERGAAGSPVPSGLERGTSRGAWPPAIPPAGAAPVPGFAPTVLVGRPDADGAADRSTDAARARLVAACAVRRTC